MPSVNKRELAKLIKCSLPTLDRLIERYPDFPIEDRGSNGRDYSFDTEAVTAFIAKTREDEAAAASERRALLDEVEIPLLAQLSGPTDSPDARLKTIRAARELDKLGVERGQLVATAELRQALDRLFDGLATSLDNLPSLLARRHNLPPSAVDAVRQTIKEERKRMVSQILRSLRLPPGADGGEGATLAAAE